MRRLCLCFNVLAFLVGCGRPSDNAGEQVMVQTKHSHYHVHGGDIVHGHTHTDFVNGGHTHEHDGHER